MKKIESLPEWSDHTYLTPTIPSSATSLRSNRMIDCALIIRGLGVDLQRYNGNITSDHKPKSTSTDNQSGFHEHFRLQTRVLLFLEDLRSMMSNSSPIGTVFAHFRSPFDQLWFLGCISKPSRLGIPSAYLNWDHLLTPPLYHEAISSQQQIPNQYLMLSNTHTIVRSPAHENHEEIPSQRHRYQAVILTAIIVGGIILLAIIASFTYIFVKRNPVTPPAPMTTTTKRPICLNGDGLLVREDGSRVKIRDVKIGDKILVAHQKNEKEIEFRPSPIIAMDIFQKCKNNSFVNYLQMEFESNVDIQSLRLTPKHSLLVRKADQSQGKYLFADQAKIGDYLYLMKNSSHPVVEMVTNAIIKLFDDYSFRRMGHQYECPFCRDFSINVLKMLFVHMEKFHTKEFLDMVQQHRDALNVLDEAIMNIPDEADDEIPDHFVLHHLHL
ncbi:unnamed protein product [Adineta ricciae]|uniref:Hint domain-containing protein n=1 Tax=Adineta ricciae TaxID=249248 RepID=A0A815FWP7_ADIRI|nr:unnamed protein product [Adineta ricciae]